MGYFTAFVVHQVIKFRLGILRKTTSAPIPIAIVWGKGSKRKGEMVKEGSMSGRGQGRPSPIFPKSYLSCLTPSPLKRAFGCITSGKIL